MNSMLQKLPNLDPFMIKSLTNSSFGNENKISSLMPQIAKFIFNMKSKIDSLIDKILGQEFDKFFREIQLHRSIFKHFKQDSLSNF